ncbi:unnamed protein product [Caenorhabditis bovis]|uniref:DUF3105 domain-containing protein n=1 Tax=Caenorhabditis bovis TaxID=2654633 RepID=A0A8S1EK73_9PELO|nr:unnamed protein product [Caenorhabditis bovis]
MRHQLLAVLTISNVAAYKGAMMGKLTECDDANTNLELDWDPKDYSVFTCSNSMPFANVDSILFDLVKENPKFDPKNDEVYHQCMDKAIEYKDPIPVRGDHRPNWARFGEYLYAPPQRWLHNLEHGSIVLLYHPCADDDEVEKLRAIVTACIYRHVITPYAQLSPDRPLALVGWGSRLEMNHVDDNEVIDYIKNYSRRAPEDIVRDGRYDKFLIKPARFVAGDNDDKICQNFH